MSTPANDLYHARSNAFEAMMSSHRIERVLNITETETDDGESYSSQVIDSLEKKLNDLEHKIDLIIYMLKESKCSSNG